MMNTHSSSAPNLTALRGQLAVCATACANAAQRAQDSHLQTRLGSLAQQADAMKTRIESDTSVASAMTSSVVESLTQEAGAAAGAMKAATGDDGLYQAMLVMQKLCGDIQRALPAP